MRDGGDVGRVEKQQNKARSYPYLPLIRTHANALVYMIPGLALSSLSHRYTSDMLGLASIEFGIVPDRV